MSSFVEQSIHRELAVHKAVTAFLISGTCPGGVRPAVMNKLADLIADAGRTPSHFSHALFTHRVERDGQELFFAQDFRTAARFAHNHGGVVKTNLRVIK